MMYFATVSALLDSNAWMSDLPTNVFFFVLFKLEVVAFPPVKKYDFPCRNKLR